MLELCSILQHRRRTALPHELRAAGEVKREPPNLAKSSCSAPQEAWVSPGEGTQESSTSQDMSDSVGYSSPGGCGGVHLSVSVSVCMCTVQYSTYGVCVSVCACSV